ncbi:uncharacterized protein TNCV_1965781 [Trichonephila clavipes]|nr:uncharacterized protein TNCV_1965781 [Trichonephila clavipes]
MLLGADIIGNLLIEDEVKHLKGGLVAVNTHLGWTVMGKMKMEKERHSNVLLSLHVSDNCIKDFWSLDVLGIKDPFEKKTRIELEEAAKDHFARHVTRDADGDMLSLERSKNLGKYEAVFHSWQNEDIIEEVQNVADKKNGHYLPHHPVYNDNSTTKIRPVFDGSAKEKNSSSINECLEKGPNMVELIPTTVNKFRLRNLAKFNLRGWVHTGVSEAEKRYSIGRREESSCFGFSLEAWTKTLLSVNWEENSKIDEIPVTKRKILSAVHRIFDPIRFTCPVTLEPKILLQECRKLGVSWDTELPLSISRKFERWKEHLKCLNNLEIPRFISKELSPNSDLSLHVFCDASKATYASCVFLRTEVGGAITCQLVQARARVASIKPITIPRLELLACTIGSRLINTTKIDLGLENVPIYCWSNSVNALYWIKRKENWGTFVNNRVQEIRRLTNPEDWNHIPGILNPADLPSRGCGVVELIASLWWEGPSWLNKPREEWPLSEACPDRAIIDSERKRTVASTINNEPKEMDYLSEISSFKKIIRVTAWIYRFYHNLRKQRNDRDFGELITQETDAAERKVLKIVQKQKLFQTILNP